MNADNEGEQSSAVRTRFGEIVPMLRDKAAALNADHDAAEGLKADLLTASDTDIADGVDNFVKDEVVRALAADTVDTRLFIRSTDANLKQLEAVVTYINKLTANADAGAEERGIRDKFTEIMALAMATSLVLMADRDAAQTLKDQILAAFGAGDSPAKTAVSNALVDGAAVDGDIFDVAMNVEMMAKLGNMSKLPIAGDIAGEGELSRSVRDKIVDIQRLAGVKIEAANQLLASPQPVRAETPRTLPIPEGSDDGNSGGE
ncbi:hypothetical protein HN511_03695 [bacterium]|nr:hypothetical protein [bacterium]